MKNRVLTVQSANMRSAGDWLRPAFQWGETPELERQTRTQSSTHARISTKSRPAHCLFTSLKEKPSHYYYCLLLLARVRSPAHNTARTGLPYGAGRRGPVAALSS